jgi:hypothetical protein
LRTDYPVDVNAELSFSRGLEDKAGVVKWREKISEENRYRIGVRFLKQ